MRLTPTLPLVLAWMAAGPVLAADDILGLPAYPQTESTKYKGQMRTNDVPLDAVVATTGDDIDTVFDHYEKIVSGMKNTAIAKRMGPGLGYVGYYDPQSKTMRLVTIVQMANGRSMLVYSNMDPRPLLTNSAEAPKDLPAPPEVKDVVTTESREGQGRHRSLSFKLPGKSAEEARAMVMQLAGKKGWQPAPREDSLGDAALVLVKQGARCVVRISADEDGSKVTMIVIENKVRENAP